jgi:hypothetical protein
MLMFSLIHGDLYSLHRTVMPFRYDDTDRSDNCSSVHCPLEQSDARLVV